MPSDIRVFVRWTEPCVFAGEEARCTITFKNVADISEEHGSEQKHGPWGRGDTANGFRSRRLSNGGPFSPAAALPHSMMRSGPPSHGHRPSASLSITPSSATFPKSTPWSVNERVGNRPHNHQRSVSIVSLGGSESGPDATTARTLPQVRRPTIGHSRSTSMQAPSRKQIGSQDFSRSGKNSRSGTAQRHPSLTHLDKARSNLQVPSRPSRRPSGLSSQSASPTGSDQEARRTSPLSLDFKFPVVSSGSDTSSPVVDTRRASIPVVAPDERKSTPPTILSGHATAQAITASRVLSGASIDGSARDSGEFYTMSNQSTDTLASEQPFVAQQRPFLPGPNRSRVNSVQRNRRPERLLMGYAQMSATFVVDGSLVDQSPFEEVKRKGFMGGQGGGGVVGVEKRKSAGGLLGGFNLNSISESLGGLLNAQDMSSSKEMKNLISSRAVPLLSTPQSLLFVDMELKPGEERSFSYSYKLPRGLPASHKGKAIKISYNLTIGTQFEASGNILQKVRSVDVPLRVFSGVSSDGEVLGHDLMQPYVILRDTAKTVRLGDVAKHPSGSPALRSVEAFTADFNAYTRALAENRFRRQSSTATIDEGKFPSGRTSSSADCKELVRLAIIRSNRAVDSERSPNRFEISRNGRYVGVVVLNRPAHRIGETVVASIDFEGAQVPTLSLRCMLETCEKVEPSLALRSIASISRSTKKVHASQSENTIYAKRAVFTPSIPAYATPTLVTSGVSLCWQLRLEFATMRTPPGHEEDAAPGVVSLDLLEEIARDDRGISRAALESLPCESFEVAIPLTVYGDIIRETEEEEVLGLPI